MKGLLYKTLIDAWRTGRFYIILMVLLCVFVVMIGTDSMNNLIWLVYPLLLLSSLPFAALSVDEKCGWDSYYDALPATRAQRVSATYLVTLLLTGGGALLLGALLLLLRAGENAVDFLLFLLPPAALLFPAVTLPFCFAQGGVKGATNSRYFLILFVVGITVLQVTVDTEHFALPSAIDFSPWLSPVVFAAIFALSWVISIKLYEKREI